MSNIRITFIDGDDGLVDKVEDVLLQKEELGISIIGKYNTKRDFFENRKISLETDIFVVSANLPDGTGIEIVEFIKGTEALRSKKVFLLIDKQTMNYAAVAEEKGVEELIQKPFNLKDFIRLAYKHMKNQSGQEREEEVRNRKEREKNEKVYKQIESFDDLQLNEAGGKTESTKKGVFTFLSTASTGKTTILTNLAYALRNLEEDRPTVCILDLNLYYPSVVYMFEQDELIMAKRDIYDVTKELNYLNEELLSEAIIKHEKTGIDILNTPTSLESIAKAGSIGGAQIEKLVVVLREMYDIVLIDTPNIPTDEAVLAAMQYSNKNFVVLEPNFINVVGTNKILFVMEKLEEGLKEDIKNKTHLILNKENKRNSIDNETTKHFLEGKRIETRIPEDLDYLTILNKGQFVLETNSPMAPAILELSKILFSHDGKIKEKKRGLGSLFSKKKKGE